LDKTEMAHEIRKTIEEDGRTILTGEGHKIVVSAGVCSDHASKAPGDCCREAVRKAAKEYSEKDEKV